MRGIEPQSSESNSDILTVRRHSYLVTNSNINCQNLENKREQKVRRVCYQTFMK